MCRTPTLDERLDEALDESFPAIDPPAVHPPVDARTLAEPNRSECIVEIIAVEAM